MNPYYWFMHMMYPLSFSWRYLISPYYLSVNFLFPILYYWHFFGGVSAMQWWWVWEFISEFYPSHFVSVSVVTAAGFSFVNYYFVVCFLMPTLHSSCSNFLWLSKEFYRAIWILYFFFFFFTILWKLLFFIILIETALNIKIQFWH